MKVADASGLALPGDAGHRRRVNLVGDRLPLESFEPPDVKY